ncbi:MAG: D-alanine--D-alanine ligase [Deltaproteobacteria bacterium]|nr:MAG: D-alanine--D-alanine ligase [Deltaproteobacteria bacterium]
MSEKLRVGVLMGGRSAEHEVSLRSAKNVVLALDKDKYDITLLGLNKQGEWFWYPNEMLQDLSDDPKTVALPAPSPDQAVAVVPGREQGQLLRLTSPPQPIELDVIFPVLHGTNAEDGTMQGLLEIARLPYVGADVLGSSVGMDKDVAKRLLRDAGIPNANFLTVWRHQRDAISFGKVVETLGLPCFVKPANAGSSVGVHKVTDAASFEVALDDAFKFDVKLLIEEAIVGRELECSVLGNETPEASTFGEVIPQVDFYSYEAKYLDEDGAVLAIPAEMTEEQIKAGQELAIRTYQTLNLEGMSRVDVFLRESDGTFLVNEVNTLPGFTAISMYPKLWEVSGLPYSQLLDRLIEFALARFQRQNELSTSFF